MNEQSDNRQEAGTAAPESAGQRLRAARERAGWNQERLAGEMGLPLPRLQALEADDYEGFGGEVFVRGFLRRAAAVLSIPAGDLVDAYAASARHPAQIMPELPPGHLPRAGWPGWTRPVAGAAVAAAVVALAWWTLRPDGAPEPPPVAEQPPALSQPLPVEPAPPARAPDATEAVVSAPVENPAPDASAVPDEEPAATGTATEAAPGTAPAAVVAETPAAQEAAPSQEPALELPVMAELRFVFTEDCWVEVSDAREQRLAYRLYRAGDVARLSGVPPLAVFLGNAEGVRLTVDGEPVAVRPAATRNGTARLTVGGGTG